MEEDCHYLKLQVPVLSEAQIEELLIAQNAKQGVWRLKIVVTNTVTFHLEPYSYSFREKQLSIRYFERAFAKVKSAAVNEEETLFVNKERIILEGNITNFLWFYNQTFFYVDPSLPYYEGMMQRVYLKRALQHGIKVQAKVQNIDDLPYDANLFTSNSLQGLVPVTQVGERCFSRNIGLESKFSL